MDGGQSRPARKSACPVSTSSTWRAEAGCVGQFGQEQSRVIFEAGMTALTANGILGDARPADTERGRCSIDAMAGFLAGWFTERLRP
jgi:creatinine amidohydrolase/Fe(II)-dependent formamide hydrolase-like protein